MDVGAWDIILVLAVSVQCTVIAYVRQPRWKALVMGLPVPFTTASLALGRPVDTTHISGVVLLLLFVLSVRWLHARLRVPIVPAIAGPAVGYCVVAAAVAPLLPQTDGAFFAVAALVLAVAVGLFLTTPHRPEPGHRSPLPLWAKLPAIAALIGAVVAMKGTLQGFMPLFPMVTIVTLYEARHSLWRVFRQVPVFLLAFVPMAATVRLAQGSLGLGGALAVGWVAFLAVLAPLMWLQWSADERLTRTRRAQPAVDAQRRAL